jgi:hypothetical protein
LQHFDSALNIEHLHAECITFQNREQDVHLLGEGVFQDRLSFFLNFGSGPALTAFLNANQVCMKSIV